MVALCCLSPEAGAAGDFLIAQEVCASINTWLLIEFAMRLVKEAMVEGPSNGLVYLTIRRLSGCGLAYKLEFAGQAICSWLWNFLEGRRLSSQPIGSGDCRNNQTLEFSLKGWGTWCWGTQKVKRHEAVLWVMVVWHILNTTHLNISIDNRYFLIFSLLRKLKRAIISSF